MSLCQKVYRTPAPPPPPPPSHRTRGYLWSFPISWTPPLSRVLVTFGNYKKTPPFPSFLGKSSRDYGQQTPPFPRKWEYACGPSCIWVGGGGGWDRTVTISSSFWQYRKQIQPLLSWNSLKSFNILYLDSPLYRLHVMPRRQCHFINRFIPNNCLNNSYQTPKSPVDRDKNYM